MLSVSFAISCQLKCRNICYYRNSEELEFYSDKHAHELYELKNKSEKRRLLMHRIVDLVNSVANRTAVCKTNKPNFFFNQIEPTKFFIEIVPN